MTDYVTMQTRIADELVRGDLSSQIKSAIQSAIDFYETQRFWFNETRSTIATVDGTEYYDLPTDFLEMDTLGITISSRYYQLVAKTHDYLDQINWGAGTWKGFPYFYSLFDNDIRLYPIPDGAYTLTLTYLKQLDALSADTDTNNWMTTAEELIRTRAKVDLLENVIRGKEALKDAERLRVREREVFNNIFTAGSKRVTTGRIRPSLM